MVGSIQIWIKHHVVSPLAARHHRGISLGKNLVGAQTNSDLKLATLVLHEATFLDVFPDTNMAAPHSGSDNIHTVSWSTREASTINPVAVELLRIRAIHSQSFF